VLLTAGLVAAPLAVATSLQGTVIFQISIYLSVGAFLNTLLIPSAAEPEASDLSRPLIFFSKWILAKIDAFVKTALACGAIWLLLRLPYISSTIEWWADNAFPQTSSAGRKVIEQFLDGGVTLALFVALLRTATLFAYRSKLVLLLYPITLAFIWVNYQWVFDRIIPEGDLTLLASKGLLTTLSFLLIDLSGGFLSALIDRTSKKAR
jgi:hypothetical protein